MGNLPHVLIADYRRLRKHCIRAHEQPIFLEVAELHGHLDTNFRRRQFRHQLEQIVVEHGVLTGCKQRICKPLMGVNQLEEQVIRPRLSGRFTEAAKQCNKAWRTVFVSVCNQPLIA